MGGLELLSALNWAMALLYALVFAVALLFFPVPASALLVLGMLLVIVAVPHVYLGLFIERGKGRGLQAVMAVVSLLNFPLGTLFGIFALTTIYSEANAHLFEGEQHAEPEEEELDPNPDESPWALARRLAAAGKRARVVAACLAARGLDEDEVQTLLSAVGLAPQRAAAARRPAATREPVSRSAPRKPPTRTSRKPAPRARPSDQDGDD